MRVFIILLLFAGTAQADDKIIDEVRAGILQHDIRGGIYHAHERGKDINGELLFVPGDNKVIQFLLDPRFHLGASVNIKGCTDQFYAGLTWHFNVYEPVFIELTFGGEIHTGRTSIQHKRRRALGTRGLFRESISLGYAINENHNISIMLDHASNSRLASRNPGLTGLGLRYGYRF